MSYYLKGGHAAGFLGVRRDTLGMGQEIVYCGRCQNRLKGVDFERGTAVRLSNHVCCFECLTDAEKQTIQKILKPKDPVTSSRLPTVTPKPAGSGAVRTVPEGKPSKLQPAVLIGGGIAVLALVAAAWLAFRPGSREKEPSAPLPPSAATTLTGPADPPAIAKDFRPELDAINLELAGPVAQHNFKFAQAIVDRARPRHPEASWTEAMASLDRDLADRARLRYQALLDVGTKAVERKAFDEVRDARAEIARWGAGFEKLLHDFEETFRTALATETPKPSDPPKPVDPVPVEPKVSPALKAYGEAWEKAMAHAIARNYDRAISDLQAAARESKDEDVRKRSVSDLQDLDRLKSLVPELIKTAATIAAWEDVSLEIFQEDGSRLAVKSKVNAAGPRRLELRGEPRMVELSDLTPASLARIHLKKKSPLPPEDRRALALLCALDGDLDGAVQMFEGQEDTGMPQLSAFAPKARELAPKPDAASRKKEWEAKNLFYKAEAEYRALETRAAALEKCARLLEGYADTEFVKANRGDLTARTEEARDYLFTAFRMAGKGSYVFQKLPVVLGKDRIEMAGWKTKEDPPADDPNNFVEATFFAPANVEYKAYALIGGCCATTFTWFLQANELTYVDKKTKKVLNCDPGGNFAAPWDLKLKSLSTTHGGKNHAKAEREPIQWEWVDLPISKFAVAGPKTIRFMAASKGMAVAAVIVSANRDKRPTPEETKKLAELSLEEGVPASGLRVGKGEPDLLTQIPEAKTYSLVYDLDLAKIKRPVAYDIDNRATVTRPFDRIAYLVELQKSGGPMQFVFVSMDAFTTDIGKVGVPDTATGASFQMKVVSMNVHSNVEGVATGIGLDGGNIEFWPNNYGPHNQIGIPDASNDKFDFGDQMGQPADGYGCMQVHNHKAKQTIFAINKWNAGNNAEMGIGNSPAGNPDYTFTNNGASYGFKRLRVLVRQRP